MIWESREDIKFEIVNFYEQLYTGGNWDRPLPNGVHSKQLEPHKALWLEESFS